MYESRHQPPLPIAAFARRFVWHLFGAVSLVLGSAAIGTGGFMLFEQLAWHDALLNSSAMLTGMGIVHEPQSAVGKLFTTGFAFYAGLLFVTAAGLVLAPLVHRLLHTFHWQE